MHRYQTSQTGYAEEPGESVAMPRARLGGRVTNSEAARRALLVRASRRRQATPSGSDADDLAYSAMMESGVAFDVDTLRRRFPTLDSKRLREVRDKFSADGAVLISLQRAIESPDPWTGDQAQAFGVLFSRLSYFGTRWLARSQAAHRRFIAPLQERRDRPDTPEPVRQRLASAIDALETGRIATVTATEKIGDMAVLVEHPLLANASPYVELLGEINAVFGSRIPPPHRVGLDLQMTRSRPHHRSSEDDRSMSHVSVGVAMGDDGTSPRWDARAKTTVAHEYGHALFETYLYNSSRSFKERERLFAAADEARANADEVAARKLEWMAKEYSFRLKLVASPYHELFADTVAVLFADDGAAMAKALRDEPDYADDSTMRDFTRPHTIASIRKTKRYAVDHHILAPVRTLLWQARLDQSRRGIDGRADILAALIEHSASEIDRLIDSNVKLSEGFLPDVTALNQPLLELLRADRRLCVQSQ